MGSHKYHSPISGGADILTGINTALGEIDNGVGRVGVLSVAVLGDTGADGTVQGNSSTGYDTRPLGDIEQDSDGIVTVSSNQFTPARGTYLVVCSTATLKSVKRLQLYNVTQTSVVFTSFSLTGSGGGIYNNQMMFVFEANGTDAYEIREYMASVTSNAFGYADHISSNTETFLECVLIKVA